MNNYELMQKFLDEIKVFAVSNPDKKIDANFVYSRLASFNFPVGQTAFIDTLDECKKVSENLRANEKGKLSWRKGFLCNYYGKTNGNEIKLYVPVKKEFLTDSATKIFRFMTEARINNTSKVALKMRNDNIVIRVNNLDDADKVMNFIKNDEYIKTGLMTPNPFLPNKEGIGLAMDNNFSFNYELSKLIAAFTNYPNALTNYTVSTFHDFLKISLTNLNKQHQLNYTGNDLDLKDLYTLLIKRTNPNFNISHFYTYANIKMISKYDRDNERIINPKFYFDQAIKETRLKYPQNLPRAILKFLNNDPLGFTNNNLARSGLIMYVTPDIAIEIMKQYFIDNDLTLPNTTEKLVNLYYHNFIYNENNVPKIEQYEMLKKAFLATKDKYSLAQAKYALKKLLLFNDASFFTNDDNCRINIIENVIGSNITEIMLWDISLQNMVDININEIIEIFINNIEKGLSK